MSKSNCQPCDIDRNVLIHPEIPGQISAKFTVDGAAAVLVAVNLDCRDTVVRVMRCLDICGDPQIDPVQGPCGPVELTCCAPEAVVHLKGEYYVEVVGSSADDVIVHRTEAADLSAYLQGMSDMACQPDISCNIDDVTRALTVVIGGQACTVTPGTRVTKTSLPDGSGMLTLVQPNGEQEVCIIPASASVSLTKNDDCTATLQVGDQSCTVITEQKSVHDPAAIVADSAISVTSAGQTFTLDFQPLAATTQIINVPEAVTALCAALAPEMSAKIGGGATAVDNIRLDYIPASNLLRSQLEVNGAVIEHFMDFIPSFNWVHADEALTWGLQIDGAPLSFNVPFPLQPRAQGDTLLAVAQDGTTKRIAAPNSYLLNPDRGTQLFTNTVGNATEGTIDMDNAAAHPNWNATLQQIGFPQTFTLDVTTMVPGLPNIPAYTEGFVDVRIETTAALDDIEVGAQNLELRVQAGEAGVSTPLMSRVGGDHNYGALGAGSSMDDRDANVTEMRMRLTGGQVQVATGINLPLTPTTTGAFLNWDASVAVSIVGVEPIYS